MKMESFQTAVIKRRIALDLPRHKAALQIGIGLGTLLRFENDQGDISARKFLKIINWLELP